jgi:serine/threonine-protein kinase
VVGRSATVGNMLVGTPHYAQPEQLETNTLTPAADVYSLGMVLFVLLSGFTPFVPDKIVGEVIDMWIDSPLQWLRAHAQEAVIPLRQRVGSDALSDDLCAVVEQCLAKSPTERPQDAGALGEMLRQAWPS